MDYKSDETREIKDTLTRKWSLVKLWAQMGFNKTRFSWQCAHRGNVGNLTTLIPFWLPLHGHRTTETYLKIFSIFSVSQKSHKQLNDTRVNKWEFLFWGWTIHLYCSQKVSLLLLSNVFHGRASWFYQSVFKRWKLHKKSWRTCINNHWKKSDRNYGR